jgi:hypothetical protein
MKKVLVLLFAVGIGSVLCAQNNRVNFSKRSMYEQLIGTWELISVDNIFPDSSRVHPYGDCKSSAKSGLKIG